ncbi:MAG: hypothetical protein RLZ45_1378 [Verrucomicrobiota bacterium]|jgi:hypothetical protein
MGPRSGQGVRNSVWWVTGYNQDGLPLQAPDLP